MKLIDGKAVSASLKEALKEQVATFPGEWDHDHRLPHGEHGGVLPEPIWPSICRSSREINP